MSAPLYTNNTSDEYRQLAHIMRDKMNNIRNSDRQSMFKYAGIPNVLEKCNNLVIECDNIWANWLSDVDYLHALLRLKDAFAEVNIALDSYNSSMYVVPLAEVYLSNYTNDPQPS
jgi:hypothetical protein